MTTNTIKKVAIIIKKSDRKTTSLVNKVIETLYNNRLEIFIIHPLEHKLAKTILSIKYDQFRNILKNKTLSRLRPILNQF